jgi:hypothetical protein
MAASVLEAVETTAVAQLLITQGVTSAKPVPCGQMFSVHKNKAGDDVLVPQTLPDSYPGCVISVVEEDVREQPGGIQNPSSARAMFRGSLYTAIYAASPSQGVVANDARYKAWEVGEAIIKAFMLLVPDGAPVGVTPWPLRFGKMWELEVDATTHGLMLVHLFDYSIAVTV